jgi:hypothetical protein
MLQIRLALRFNAVNLMSEPSHSLQELSSISHYCCLQPYSACHCALAPAATSLGSSLLCENRGRVSTLHCMKLSSPFTGRGGLKKSACIGPPADNPLVGLLVRNLLTQNLRRGSAKVRLTSTTSIEQLAYLPLWTRKHGAIYFARSKQSAFDLVT